MADNQLVVDDLSAFLIAGRVISHHRPDAVDATGSRTPVDGINDGVMAEALGFRRVFLSERWNLKEGEGLRTQGFQGLCDYVDIVRRLWGGETVSYDGPAGRYDNIKLGDTYEGPQPKVWYGTFGLPHAAQAVARAFDGVLLPPVFTPDATAAAVARIRSACDRVGRDPETVRICQCVITAPDLSDDESRALAHARAVTYLQAPEYGDALVRANGWDTGPVEKLRAHPQFSGRTEMADLGFHRIELMEPSRLIPEAWMQETSALGSVRECVAKLQQFRDAGADEIATYGSTPGQNVELIDARRRRDSTRPTPVGQEHR